MSATAQLPPLLRISKRPAVCVASDATVRDAIRVMVENKVGAVAVVRDDALIGIFTERDLLVKVVHTELDPDTLPIADVMAMDIVTIAPTGKRRKAIRLMVKHHIRHLPVTDAEGQILGMLSMRHLYRSRLRRMQGQMDTMEAYIGADGPGG